MGQIRHGSAPDRAMVRHRSENHGGGTPSEQHCSDRKLRSRALSEEPGINPKTVAKRRKRATAEDLKDGPERAALDGSDRGRRSGDRRIPASYAAAAGRFPPCPAAVHPAPDALGAAPVPAAMSH